MLDKKELLRKYIIINGEASLEKGEALSQRDNNTIEANGILEKATLNFFLPIQYMVLLVIRIVMLQLKNYLQLKIEI